jgi:hypothetical protein
VWIIGLAAVCLVLPPSAALLVLVAVGGWLTWRQASR